MSDDLSSQFIRCPQCGAECDRSRSKCWVCESELRGAAAGDAAATIPDGVAAIANDAAGTNLSFSTATLLLIMTIGALVLGVAAEAPGLAVFIAIVLAPICFRTIGLVRRRERAGERVSTLEKASLIGASFVTAVTFLIVVCCALFCSFCGVCLIVVSAGGPPRDRGFSIVGVAVAALGVACFVLTVKMYRWMKQKRKAGELPL
ncbi:MAG: hypothetical protein KF847_13170 [Pirellulales bacterium]|nr:hypothetical protein [Pirellulales bacterium]